MFGPIFILFVALFGALTAEPPRIAQLLPRLDTPLAVEPMLPADFIALPKDDWVYWGPKEVVEAYFANSSSLKTSILRVRPSETVKQVGPDTFSAENDELCKLMAPLGLKRLFDVRMKWGKYPIYAVTCEFQKKWLYTAWVGLSDPQGTTLLFELVYPGTKPTQEQFALWDQFLDRTVPLQEPMYSSLYKLEYKKGVTELTFYGSSLAITAEQRYSDKEIRVMVDVKNSGFTTRLDSVYFAHIAPTLEVNGPGAKVYFSLVRTQNGKEELFTQMIPVLVQPVEAFSHDSEKVKASGGAVYEQQLHCMLREYLRSK